MTLQGSAGGKAKDWKGTAEGMLSSEKKQGPGVHGWVFGAPRGNLTTPQGYANSVVLSSASRETGEEVLREPELRDGVQGWRGGPQPDSAHGQKPNSQVP